MTPRTHRFIGQNIMGTPQMARFKVVHDLLEVMKHADSFVVQEFKWRSYWTAVFKCFRLNKTDRWQSYPHPAKGVLRPIRGGQAVFWKRTRYTAKDYYIKLIHKGVGGISDDRWCRGVLLEDIETKLCAWRAGTHPVVHGDHANDPAKRRGMMKGDLVVIRESIAHMQASGWPILWEMDGNIHPGTEADDEWQKIIHDFKGMVYGTHGVEWMVVFPGSAAKIDVGQVFQIPNAQIYTDHEGRGIVFHEVVD